MSPQDFWNWFAEDEQSLWERATGVAEAIQEKLAAVDDKLWVEVSSPVQGRRELTFSAGGARERFAAVDSLVAAAPSLERWVVFALTPPRGFQFVIEHRGHRLQATALDCEVVSVDPQSRVSLRILVPDQPQDEGLVEALWQALAIGLGERLTAERIASVQIASAPEGTDKPLPLFALESYLTWLDRGTPQSPPRG